jgi:hypothetical protein
MAYVYEHIRKDTNQVFYIGIGSDNTFSRAFYTHNRNYLWNEVVEETDYEIKIIERDIDWETACSIEQALIKKYGRVYFGDGILTNLTEGGDGFKQPHSEETKLKISKTTKGKTYEERYGEEKARELKVLRQQKQKEIWQSRSNEEVDKIKKKISKGNVGIKHNHPDVECPHCGKVGKNGVMGKWHFDKCKVFTGKSHTLSEEHKEKLKGERLQSRNLVWINDGNKNKRVKNNNTQKYLSVGWKLGMLSK